MSTLSYLRYPHLNGERLIFVAEDDLWLAPVGGGTASRLTADRSPAAGPRLSADGRLAAWTSARDGETEAYSVPLEGGSVTRLTYGGAARIAGWIGEEAVVVAPHAGLSMPRRPWAHAIGQDGRSRVLPYGPVVAVDHAADGAVLINSLSWTEQAYWKRYRGGSGGRLWLDRAGDGGFARFLAEIDGNLQDPMFVGERIAFLSEHEGVGALYSVARDGGDLRRHTDHGPHYARHPTTDGDRVVYECAGEIWLLPSLGQQPVRLEISLGGARSGRAPYPVSTAEWLGGYGLSADGRVAAAEVRGTVHWLPAERGPARVLLAEPAVRARTPAVVPSSDAVLCVSDAGGEDGLDLIPADGCAPARRIGEGRLGHVYEFAVSPDGRWAAVSAEDGRLLLVDLGADSPAGTQGHAGDSIRELTRAEIYEPRGLVFSPDSTHLAWAEMWAMGRGYEHFRVRLARLEDGAVVDVTEARFSSWSPVFTHDGRYLAFLSDRTYDTANDSKLFDLGFMPGVRPYLVTLAADTPDPFGPEIDGRPSIPAQPAPSDQDAGAPAETRIEVRGIDRRIVPFPVEAGTYTHLSAVRGGVAWLQSTHVGDLGEAWRGSDDRPPTTRLIRFDIAARERAELVEALDSYRVSGDGRRIAYRAEGALKIKAVEGGKDGRVVEVDLERIRVSVDPVAEWTQMYHEAWRLMRDNFWQPGLPGLVWPAMAERHRPMLTRLGSADDFNDLLWQLQGETGYSHGYAIAPTPPVPPARRQGYLGAVLDAPEPGSGAGWRIRRVLPGEISVAAGRSPLAAPGIQAEPGDEIAAVDGRPVDPARGPGPLLVGKADVPVELTLRRDGRDRRVVVVPLATEKVLRYHDLIAQRRARVRELSGGRLGYLHVPDMVESGWAEMHRGHGAEYNREGLVVDLRENGGGRTSQLVIEKLRRRIIGWTRRPVAPPYTWPTDAPRGPVVALIDELAGSDGDIGAHALRTYGIGPLVGTRTWGGVVGYDRDRVLADGTVVSQPKGANWFEGVGWGLENHGVDPDIEVEVTPQDYVAGRDPQLDTAVHTALDALAQTPAATPPNLPGADASALWRRTDRT